MLDNTQQEIITYLLSIGMHKVRATEIMRLEHQLDKTTDKYDRNIIEMKMDGADVDFLRFDCCMRIHEVHYLFYSSHFKHFTLSIYHQNPKGTPGAGNRKPEFFTHTTIPKVIYTIKDAELLLIGLGCLNTH